MPDHAPITLDALYVIDTIARRGSYAAAAEELNRVPSALSYIIQNLEEKLGVTLFSKQGRKSVLTPAGNHLLHEGRTILEAVARLGESTRNIANGWESRLRIAVDSMCNDLDTFKILETFVSAYPGIEVDLREEVMFGSWEALINDEVDLLIGASGPVPRHKGIHAEQMGQLDLVYAVSPQHPLAREAGPISLERLAHERTVVVHDSAHSAIPWTRGLLTETRHLYVPTHDCKIRAQRAGIGAGHLPRHRVQQFLDSGELVELQLEQPNPEAQIDIYLAWKLVNQDRGLKALVECFRRNIRQHQK